MQVRLKKQVIISVLDEEFEYVKVLLPIGSAVWVEQVTEQLAKECEILFKDYVGQYFIDTDVLFGKDYIVDDVDQLILDFDDFEFVKSFDVIMADSKAIINRLSEKLDKDLLIQECIEAIDTTREKINVNNEKLLKNLEKINADQDSIHDELVARVKK